MTRPKQPSLFLAMFSKTIACLSQTHPLSNKHHCYSNILHILANFCANKTIEIDIICITNTYICDHSPIFLISNPLAVYSQKKGKVDFYKRFVFHESKIETNWTFVKTVHNLNLSYELFFDYFTLLYDNAFPKQVIELKKKDLTKSWITNGLKQSSKKKQKPYGRFP